MISTVAARAGTVLVDNPAAVGGATAFLVALSFVSANALWYQPQLHPSAFVSTRDHVSQIVPADDMQREITPPRPETAPRQDIRALPFDEQVVPAPSNEPTGSVTEDTGDDTVRAVQRVLNDLGLYRGPVDGLSGPQTHAAVENYRRIVGLEEGGEIDDALLRQLGLKEAPQHQQAQLPAQIPEIAPKPTPRPTSSDAVQTASLERKPPQATPAAAATEEGDELLKRVQAGLRAFGNDGIQIDGVMGENTRLAIREFQSLFGLPVTGEVDETLIAKMREIGLTN